MELINQYISEDVTTFTESENNIFFSEVFANLTHPDKLAYKGLLLYIHTVLAKTYSSVQNELNILHLHIEINFDINVKTLIAEFLWCHYFKNDCKQDNALDVENIALKSKIVQIEIELKRDVVAPESNNRRELTRIINHKKALRNYLGHYKVINKCANLKPRTIINLKVNQENNLARCFIDNPFYLNVQNLSELNSYVLNNVESFNSISQTQLENKPLFKVVENIILFDCENSTQRFGEFNVQQLSNLNNRHNTNFKFFIIFSFGTDQNSLNDTRNKIDRIKSRFFIPNQKTYTLTSSEVNTPFRYTTNKKIPVLFLGESSSTFWEQFQLEAKINSLYELRSIKIMNLYSICLNQEMKDYIMNDLFNAAENSNLINSDTKQGIQQLQEKDWQTLKDNLSFTLDLVIECNLKDEALKNINNDTRIILDDYITQNEFLLSSVHRTLGVSTIRRFISWSDIQNNLNYPILILSYRDQGNFKNHFYPNLMEIDLPNESEVTAIFPDFLFKSNYQWSTYNLNKDYFDILNHPTRNDYFNWDNLKLEINKIRPEKPLEINWDNESEYYNTDATEKYRIHYLEQRSKTYNGSDLFIYDEINSNSPRIERMKWMYDNLDFNETKYSCRKLEDLLDDFNPAEKLVDTSKQEAELSIIKKQFNLEEENAGRLWKLLLKRKADAIGCGQLYNELKVIFDKNSVNIVSINHFETTWVNPNSDSLIPRGNKVFRIISDYLNLPSSYRLIMYRLKNQSIRGQISATRTFSRLLKDLFYDKCFDEGGNPKVILENRIEYYKTYHNLEEMGINENDPITSLIILIDLLKPEIHLLKIKSIEKVIE